MISAAKMPAPTFGSGYSMNIKVKISQQAAALTLIILGIGYIVARERRNRATTGAEGMVGEVGEVREAIAPGKPGRVFVHGEIWRAVSTDALGPGARARVQSINGLELQVQKA